ncbi:hypothetical protein HOLleu_37810 [Holothuria leucospilota]|uniref:Uncharacterized protein n=1 Tax=Holothuria leucospilota TaxID=206669 RepID=A0A9Q0YMD2_HOLLE|nr:hypothetical protein HOLleu_37810 [Holothuria leucospilota]
MLFFFLSFDDRNDLKKKRQKRVHDDIMSNVMSDMLEMINMNTKIKAVTSLERKGQTKLTKKRRELLEMQQEHRKLCGRISDLKRQKRTSAANPAKNEEISEFLKSLQQLYKEAGQKSSKGE